jgi:4-amino-4-deoxy-L-arabinose transferase-like glycosyltransferase
MSPRAWRAFPSPDSRTWRLVATGATLAGAIAIASTYRVFSQTVDEPAHLAAGMEWLSAGRYTYEAQHPPLTRIAAALGPYLAGGRTADAPSIWTEGRELLGSGPHYVRTLALARLGELPFFLLLSLVMWMWGRRLTDERGAALAVVFTACNSNLLAHAGLATTDFGVVTTVTAALLAFLYWLERPGWLESLFFGAALGLSAVTKFSAVAFLGVALAGVLILRGVVTRSWRLPDTPRALGAGAALLAAAATACVVVWATYRFSIGPLRARPSLVLPAPAFFDGLMVFAFHGAEGAPAFLLGRLSYTGWWYYFPVAILVKTPLPLLLLGVAGAVIVIRDVARRAAWEPAVPLVGILAVLVVSMPVHVNIGIRHVLPVYPLLALLATLATIAMWRAGARRRELRVVAAVLVALTVIIPARAHPDHLAYFNFLAGPHPEEVLVDSNLDWGQDLYRLADTVRARGIDSVRVAYFGSASLSAAGVPNARRLAVGEQVTGWVAASETFLAGEWVGPALAWLKRYRPVTRIGPSMRLYYVPPSLAHNTRSRE